MTKNRDFSTSGATSVETAPASALEDLVPFSDPQGVFREVAAIIAALGPEMEQGGIRSGFEDTVRLFEGTYPGYRGSNTLYHNLDHTLAVFLTAARLLHGVYLNGRSMQGRYVEQVLFSALFHDVGLIQKDEETEGTGARFTIGHEERSVAFMHRYLGGNGYSEEFIEECADMIRATMLNMHLEEIDFRSDEAKLGGRILGAADLLAQMADRAYLEKLLLLFREFKEAGIPGFHSELELLTKTKGFYEVYFKKRLQRDFDNISLCLDAHFEDRWGIGKNLYDEAIAKNINYLDYILEQHKDRYRDKLRRKGIVHDLEVQEGEGGFSA